MNKWSRPADCAEKPWSVINQANKDGVFVFSNSINNKPFHSTHMLNTADNLAVSHFLHPRDAIFRAFVIDYRYGGKNNMYKYKFFDSSSFSVLTI